MSSSREIFDEDGNAGDGLTLDSERPLASTPLMELVRADGYRWASLDIVDLDPPTRVPPEPAR